MKSYFAYIRVSTVRQGEHGSSLQEQRDAINGFAARNGLHVVAWFDERETAAKVGRTEFTRMLAALKKGRATGVIFHKIDRSARNLKDWSAVQDLADMGIDVRFTQESINLGSNEGRLTGDFLAVISSHYIRNLREEVKKGIRGRLKQGLYPLPAPVGYLNQGGGKAKIPDPMRAPLVRLAFELYATGTYSLHTLSAEIHRRGLRSKAGRAISVNHIADLLRNPFYIGIIRMKRSGETYSGIHQAIVTKRIFARVQEILDGKSNTKAIVHNFQFRRMIACAGCGFHLIGERQKGHIYYRCHTKGCPTRTVRQELIDAALWDQLASLTLSAGEEDELRDMASSLTDDWSKKRDDFARVVTLQLENVSARLAKLTDAYLDDAVERPLFEERKLALLMERRGLDEQRQHLDNGAEQIAGAILKYLELVKSLPLSYKMANVDEKRELFKIVTSNFGFDGNNVVVKLRSPFQEAAELSPVTTGGPLRGRPRTRAKQILDVVVKYYTELVEEERRQECESATAA